MMLYPLRFEPLLRRYIWGGRRLETILRKQLPAGEDYAESWELADYQDTQSVVQFGPLRGTRLHELCLRFGRELLGTENAEKGFPLLFKFIDAQHTLSVQVHPNHHVAAALNPPGQAKTEAWIVLHAAPGSLLYAGLKKGIDRQKLEAEMSHGNIEDCLQKFVPQVGDCFLIPAGVVHAIGAGLVVGEIQQTSDTTFRLYDWNRVGVDGQPRQLHVEQALQTIDFEAAPVVTQVAMKSELQEGVERLVHCQEFVVDRCCFQADETVGGDGRFHLVVVLQGRLSVASDPSGLPLQLGQTCLIPAGIGPVRLQADEQVTLLDMYLP